MATKARYLKHFRISWARPHKDYNPGELRELSREDVVKGINKRIQAFYPLTDLITARLRREKRFLSPEITHAQVHISNVESLDFALYPRGKKEPYGLYSTFWMNPLDLLDLPADKEALGALAIDIVEEFLRGMSRVEYAVSKFPTDVFESAINDFQENKMMVRYGPLKRKIEGTSVTSVFTAEDSPGGAKVWVTFKKGKNELFKKQIGSKRAGLGAYSLGFNPEIVLANDALEIHRVALSAVIRIPYADLPPELVGNIASGTKHS